MSSSLDRAWASHGTSPGTYVVHRLNRTEYGNAVRDLLAIDVDVTSLLPSDGGDFGFDNIASSLRTSPLLLERYVTAARQGLLRGPRTLGWRPKPYEGLRLVGRSYSRL